jgi:hypothetical protein
LLHTLIIILYFDFQAEKFDLLYITTENGRRAPIVSSSHWHDGHEVAYPKHFSTERLMEALAFHEDPKDNWVIFGCELIRSYGKFSHQLNTKCIQIIYPCLCLRKC